METSNRGGKRPGAGRKPIAGIRPIQLTLDESSIAKGKLIGEGNLSAGVRKAIKRFPAPRPK